MLPTCRESGVSAFRGSRLSTTRSSIRRPYWPHLMRRVLLAAGVLAIVLVAARAIGLGTRAAPESQLYVAISRSDDETAAREIEVIDTASGERSLFDVGTKITALALAPDRRTLYVGADDGRLLLIDPTNG